MNKLFRKVMVFSILLLSAAMLNVSCSKEQSVGKDVQAATLGKPDMSTDVVVIGAGGAGLSASIKAAQLGMDVILLEKNSFPGGTTLMAEGMFAVDSHFQKDAGIKIDKVDLFRRVQEYNHWLSDSKILKRFFDESAASIDWLEDLGVKFMGVISMGDSVKTWHIFDGLGEGYIHTMHEAAIEAGVNLLLETPGKELIMEDGKVKGVIAETREGESLAIEAPVVILATGGILG